MTEQTVLKVVLDTADKKKVDRIKDRISWALNKMNDPPKFDIQDNLPEYYFLSTRKAGMTTQIRRRK